MFNLNRIDHKQLDQMPFAYAFHGYTSISSGLLVHHGDYHDDRTIDLPHSVGSIYLPTMPQQQRGYLHHLKIDSQQAAFAQVVEILTKHAFVPGMRATEA